ncbi:hypothetical protein SBA5_1070003 [Candidatus Sulfotelmatomonas gaucii]|uniref:Uncharacterized protein n=1 Tax=Candidatus Sulfuritelmatomonas gaucii TaxID=2043161 RepID=A0A2N9L2X3_9BACT|nr:hypothetical protein SBA5_1070003 [Candidatus Sulfotelmatomonas gaucii]
MCSARITVNTEVAPLLVMSGLTTILPERAFHNRIGPGNAHCPVHVNAERGSTRRRFVSGL